LLTENNLKSFLSRTNPPYEKIVAVLFPTIGKNNVITTNPSHCFGLGKLDFTPIKIAARLIFVGDAVHHFNLVTR
jgi:hypothetical protein